ncbi:MAG: nitrilase-related carbon-nitrogen hydrolase [Subdoligranulum sp.]
MKYGFLHTAAVSPALHVADCAYNTQQIIAAMRAQAVAGTKLLCLPEFTLTGYTCSDLFLQETLCRGAEDEHQILMPEAGRGGVGWPPVRHNGKLYNCAAVVSWGNCWALYPNPPAQLRRVLRAPPFLPGPKDAFEITFAGQRTLFGTNLLFACREMPAFVLGVEICEDLWAPVPPSCSHALAGATVVANLSASDETVGKAAYRRELVAGQSARLLCGYVYADAGHGESTTDMTFAAHNLIAENGTLLCEAEPFANGTAATELDLGRMVQERIRNTTFVPDAAGYTTISFDLEVAEAPLTRFVSPTPFVPQNDAARAERCELILRIQAEGLAKRMEHTHAKCAVVGISGGLDSCPLVMPCRPRCWAVYPESLLPLPPPAWNYQAQSAPTRRFCAEALGVSFTEINITNTVESHFADIGQDPHTYE